MNQAFEEKCYAYVTGEMTTDEANAFWAGLSVSERAEVDSMRTLFADLKEAHAEVPEPQISFARIRTAIEATPAPTRRPWFLPLGWSLAGAAAVALAVYLMPKSGPAPQPNGNGEPTVIAKVDEPAEVIPNVPMDANPTEPKIETAPEPAPKVTDKPTKRPANLVKKRSNRFLVASNREPRRGFPEARMKSTAKPPKAAHAGETMVNHDFGTTTADVPSVLPSRAPAAEVVVVDTGSKNTQNGTMNAVEVKTSELVVGS